VAAVEAGREMDQLFEDSEGEFGAVKLVPLWIAVSMRTTPAPRDAAAQYIGR
jgi:hypothetical protein